MASPCTYHSRVDSFNIVDATPFGRDPLRELADACGRHGVALGIYYSQNLDWHHPDGRPPGPDQPKNPFGMSWGNDWDYPDYGRKDFQRYFRQKCLPQVRELLTGYGPVCEFWCDCGFNMSEDESRELSDMIHGLQPGCVINSRISPDSRFRDFASLGDNQDMHGRSSEPVESPITLNDTWGFKHSDQNWKSPRLIAERMAALADRDANLLLNIGPDGMGRFPDGTVKVLDELARWHRRHPGAIAGTTPNPFPQDFAWGSCTQSGKRLNFFIREPRESIVIHGLKGRIAAASCPCEEAPAHSSCARNTMSGSCCPWSPSISSTPRPSTRISSSTATAPNWRPASGGRISATSRWPSPEPRSWMSPPNS